MAIQLTTASRNAVWSWARRSFSNLVASLTQAGREAGLFIPLFAGASRNCLAPRCASRACPIHSAVFLIECCLSGGFPVRAFLVITLVLCISTAIVGSCMAQDTSSSYLVRMERQTREENVWMLLQKDGHYHLERIITGRPRVFEGTLPSSAVSEIEPLLNSDQITN